MSDERIWSAPIYACNVELTEEEKKRRTPPNRTPSTVCLREMKRNADGILICPEHGAVYGDYGKD